MLLQVKHTTTHVYDSPVSYCLNEVRLTPRVMPNQTVRESSIVVEPNPGIVNGHRDYFGNDVKSFGIFERHGRFIVKAESLVEISGNGGGADSSISWEEARDSLAAQSDDECLYASQFLYDSPYVGVSAELAAFAGKSFAPRRPMLEAVKELSHRIYTEFKYEPHSTSIDTPLGEVLRRRRGVCQDFAHVMIGTLRSMRLAAKYVSGYVRSGGTYQGAQASHAWVSVFIPGSGWFSFDPTNDVMPSDGHVTLAFGRDYGDIVPVKGVTLGGGKQRVEVEVYVQFAAEEEPTLK